MNTLSMETQTCFCFCGMFSLVCANLLAFSMTSDCDLYRCTFFSSLHRFIYERLLIAKKLCSMSHNTPLNRVKHPIDEKDEGEEDTKDATDDQLDNFTHFLSTLHAVVEGTCDNSRFEEHCRHVARVQGNTFITSIIAIVFVTVDSFMPS